MNVGNIGGIIVLIGGFMFARKYIKKRITKEVKIIDNISYPKYDKRQGRKSGRERRDTERRKSGNAISIRFGI